MASEITVKVFSYNVQMRDQADAFKIQNKDRAKLIANLLVQSDYDVLVFSEAFDDSAREEMYKILKNKFSYRSWVVGKSDEFALADEFIAVGLILSLLPPFRFLIGPIFLGALFGAGSGHPKSDGGVFIISRWPIVLQGQIVYSDAQSEDRFAKKGVAWALINKQGFYFNVFATHTQADSDFAWVRVKQFRELRKMVDNVGLYWQPALIAGDLNVDFCLDGDDCTPHERRNMLGTLQADLPPDLSKFTYTSHPDNELVDDGNRPKILDYVLTSKTHQAPVRSSLETIKPRALWRTQYPPVRERHDLSDHYAVLGTFTFPFRREDSHRFTGRWKCIKFNNQPDTHNHSLTFNMFGKSMTNEFDGRTGGAIIHHITPGGANSGTVVIKNLVNDNLVTYDYFFNTNNDFKRHFVPGEVTWNPRRRRIFHDKPKAQNELFLRNATRSMLYAFESWMPAEIEIGEFRPGGPV